MGQHHDSAPSLNYTVISIDSPHMRKDGSNYLKFLLANEKLFGFFHLYDIDYLLLYGKDLYVPSAAAMLHRDCVISLSIA